MTTPFAQSKHDQRMAAIQNAITVLQGLPPTPANTQLLIIIQTLLDELKIHHDILVNSPTPAWAKMD